VRCLRELSMAEVIGVLAIVTQESAQFVIDGK
jgi:hypothetical protein